MRSSADVVVIGSANLDCAMRVPALPDPGETVLGGDVTLDCGGKGANQAVAAARLGSRVAFVGCLGQDAAGARLLAAMEADAIDTALVRRIEGVPTGQAFILVDGRGNNVIAVSPGANGRLLPDDVERAAPQLTAAPVTLLQCEVPPAIVRTATNTAGGLVVLNPAPAADLSFDILAGVDILVPNASELASLTGAEVPDTPARAAALAARLPVPRVVVTLGDSGAVVVSEGTWVLHCPARSVPVEDTTAAGDAFCGALADAMARGETLEDAVRWAVTAAAVAVTRPGAQASLPYRDAVAALV